MYFTERYDLAKYGDEFKNSYLILKLLTKQQALDYDKSVIKLAKEIETTSTESDILDLSEKLIEIAYTAVKDCFVSGLVFDGDTKVERPATVEDFDSFPPTLIKELADLVKGNIQKKN